MKSYFVCSWGYECFPEYKTKGEAETHLKELVAQSLKEAKRKSDTAKKHKLGENNYSITLGSDKNSALWAAHWIKEI